MFEILFQACFKSGTATGYSTLEPPYIKLVDSPAGRPDVLYFIPEADDRASYLNEVPVRRRSGSCNGRLL